MDSKFRNLIVFFRLLLKRKYAIFVIKDLLKPKSEVPEVG